MAKPRKPRPYFILAAFDVEVGRWLFEFGDRDRWAVDGERQDYRDHGWKAKHLKVVRAGSSRWPAVQVAIANLNGENA